MRAHHWGRSKAARLSRLCPGLVLPTWSVGCLCLLPRSPGTNLFPKPSPPPVSSGHCVGAGRVPDVGVGGGLCMPACAVQGSSLTVDPQGRGKRRTR